MMNRNSFIIGLVFMTLWGLCSCSPCSKCPYRNAAQKDSVRVEVREHTEYIHDTLKVEVPSQSEAVSLRDTLSHLENDWAESDASWDGEFLHHSLKTKAGVRPVPVDVPVVYRDSVVYRDRVVTVTKEVERSFSWWEQFRLTTWIIVAVLAVILGLLLRLKW